MASSSIRMDDVEDDFSVDNFYKETMAGEWKEVVEIYKKQTFKACRAKINELGDTTLHLAVSMAPEDIVEELVLIISQFDKNGLQMINKKGNTILHVAASASKVRTCICISEADRSLGDVRNNDGESPLFLAAYHGEKDIFLCIHYICCPHDKGPNYKSNPSYRRKGGETILRHQVGVYILASISFHFFTTHMECASNLPTRQN